MQDVRREQVILLTEWATRPFVNERRYLCAEVQEEKDEQRGQDFKSKSKVPLRRRVL